MPPTAQILPRARTASSPSSGRLQTGGKGSALGGRQASEKPLRRLFWVATAGLVLTVVAKAPGQTPESVIGALLIIVAAMLPTYLWAVGKVGGLPLFPVCALTTTWTFAMPLVSEHPIVRLFPGWNQLVAALSVTGFLLAGTLAWYLVGRRLTRPPAVCWMMNEATTVPLFLASLALCLVWTVVYTAGWVELSSGVESLTRAVLTALEALSCFVLAYRLGSRKLRGTAAILFVVLLVSLLVANLPSLLLIVTMSLLAIALLAYAVASKRLPWRVGLAAVCVFSYLHFGKAAMREKYWIEDERPPITPWQYPGFLADWMQTSYRTIRTQNADPDEREESLLERASLMHWLLYIEASTPGNVPYLSGATYAVIPHLFVPRILDPEKPRSHEATYMIAIHYGIQSREDTEITTIAFGLLNEAFANFGFWGVGALGIFLGAFYGAVARWARGMPILSLRALFAMLVASYCFQAEYTSTFYAAALFQSTVVLLLLAAVFMRPRRINTAQSSLLE